MKRSSRVRAFAKINLGLKILGRRDDGYHEIRTVYQTLALHDTLRITLVPGSSGCRLECDVAGIPTGRPNLVYGACELWRRARGFGGRIQVQVQKRIPAGAGLGGASADAAATLIGLERLTDDRLGLSERLRLAARLGSDVPLFLWGGRVLGCGRGEEVYPLWDLPSRPCLIAFPGFAIETAWAYREASHSLGLTKWSAGHSISKFGTRPQSPLENWGPAENDFEKVVFARWPMLARLKRQLLRAGAEAASLTGSGSALYAVFASARQLARAKKLIPKEWQVFSTRILPRAEYERRLVFKKT